ncbi:MAG: ABC transporter ATP-binding protein [Deltaproteobacteria bacterium]|nr:ABC transporter ATP-binding protein [Deltaproteobacteria bacterium]
MIHIENLSKNYKELQAVDQISFDIKKGEILGLLGPNGAGKTTTLRMLTCFLKPTSGTVRVKNLNIESDALAIKKLMGYLPESAPLYKDMLVYDYLVYIAGIRGVDPHDRISHIRELAGLCGLSGVMHKPIDELSKGYKQRVGLAHAMMNDPEILVLDEPTSGLDPNQIVEIREIIRQIGKQKTIILSTHILSEAEATCDRIVIINRGKIVADGSTESLKQEEGRETILKIALEGAQKDTVEQQLGGVEGVGRVEVVSAVNGDVEVKLVCTGGLETRHRVYAHIKQTDWLLNEFVLEKQSLENIFRNLTQEK